MKEGSFRVDHPLFENIIFSKRDAAELAAERLCFFLIKHTDRFEASVDVLRYGTEKFDSETQTIWWWHKTVTANLTLVGGE